MPKDVRPGPCRQVIFSGMLVLACLLGASEPRPGFAFSLPKGDSEEVRLNMVFRVQGNDQDSNWMLTTLLPRTQRPQQEVLYTEYSSEPASRFDEDGIRYASFDFTQPPHTSRLRINVMLRLRRYDLQTAQRSLRADREAHVSRVRPPMPGTYLGNARHIEVDDPTITRLATKLRKTTPSTDDSLMEQQTALTKKVYNYVVNNMRYSGYNPDTEGAVKAARLRRGDCSEYSHLFVALCRALDLPARVVEGLTSRWHNTPKHAWTEVFIDQLGWVPFDPTWGDSGTVTFDRLAPVYIALSRKTYDPRLNGFPYFSYWCSKRTTSITCSYRVYQRSGHSVDE